MQTEYEGIEDGVNHENGKEYEKGRDKDIGSYLLRNKLPAGRILSCSITVLFHRSIRYPVFPFILIDSVQSGKKKNIDLKEL
jgi:hypothetical protein